MAIECNEEDFVYTYPLAKPLGDMTTISYIEIHRKNIPEGLRKPYEYVLPVKNVKQFINKINGIIKVFNGKNKNRPCYVHRKGLSSGLHLRVQLYPKLVRYGIFSNTSEEWEQLIEDVQKTLFKYFGEDAKMFFRRMNDPTIKNQNRISAWWEAYVMFKELGKLRGVNRLKS